MPILPDYQQFAGFHWDTATIRNALAYQGLVLPHTGQPPTEALVFGISGGVLFGYFVFEYAGYAPQVNLLTRLSPATDRILERWDIPHQVKQTVSPEKAEANLMDVLEAGKVAIVWVDGVTLYQQGDEPNPDVWMMQPVIVYGYDEAAGKVYIADRTRVPLVVPADKFAAARARTAKNKHRLMTLDLPDVKQTPAAVEAGLRECLRNYTEGIGKGAASNWGLAGLQKWADLLMDDQSKNGWLKQFDTGHRLYAALTSAPAFIEGWGSGGYAGRGVYTDFLDEAAVLLQKPALTDLARQYREIAPLWRELTTALLPDSAPALKTFREEMLAQEARFQQQGLVDPARETTLYRDRSDQPSPLNLSAAEVLDLLAQVRAVVLKIYAAEKQAVADLQAILR
jgi:hypothetical protein